MINNLQDAVPQGYLDRMVHDWITEQAQKQLAILHRIELEQMKQEIKAAIRYKPGSELKAEYAQYVEY